jgi:para-nitrobenzyl esterase
MKTGRASILIAATAAITAAALIVLQRPALAAKSGGAVVNTPSGPVSGIDKGQVREFFGIPYAAPPVNDLRWKAPQPHPHWTAPLDASKPGSVCAQVGFRGRGIKGSEDCLFLNVYTPNPPGKAMPVMVWIHGGTFLVGSGNSYDGSKLAEKGHIVVVTINYRLGPLGFLAQKDLDAGDPNRTSGNYGILDQQAALRWVKDNIGAFGGDPHNVTVAGESAGGISIGMQLVSPSAAGLFERAIIESGPSLMTTPLKEAETRGDELAAKLECAKQKDVGKCLRSKSTAQVLTAIPASPLGGNGLIWSPVVDGHVIPRQPAEAFATGQFNKVPLINGSNHDEGTLFVAFSEPQTPAQFEQRTRQRAGKAADRILEAYPLKNYPTPTQAAAAIVGDSIFSCGIRKASELIAAQGVPVYEYEFNDPHAPDFSMFQPPFPLGAFHGSEIRYVFQTSMRAARQFTPAQQKLSDEMMGYWIGFITSGKPGAASPEWKPYTKSQDDILSLAPDRIGYTPDFAKNHHCDLWDSLGAERKKAE